jgi:hypothetical protein
LHKLYEMLSSLAKDGVFPRDSIEKNVMVDVTYNNFKPAVIHLASVDLTGFKVIQKEKITTVSKVFLQYNSNLC